MKTLNTKPINAFILMLTVISMSLITGCSTKTPLTTNSTSTSNSIEKLLIGKWTMSSYQYFRSWDENDHMPAYNEGDVIWEFKKNGEVHIYKTNANEENETSPGVGVYKYTIQDAKITTVGGPYNVTFESPYGSLHGNTPLPYGEEVWLDSNTDPTLSSDGPKIHLKKM